MNPTIEQLAQQVISGGDLDRAGIDTLLEQSRNDPDDLLYWANRIRRRFFGDRIRLCSIVPGRLGGCDQDCAFCAQSARYKTSVDRTAKILSDDEIITAAAEAKQNGVPHFGIVYSGRNITEAELVRLETLIPRIRDEIGIGVCAGLGILSSEQLGRLKAAGVQRYNHNLETSRRFFPRIVGAHGYDDRVNTIRAAIEAGLGVCAGGIFGLGEDDSDRVDMALELRELGPDTVPMNFLHPIPGTPLADQPTLSPREILRIIAIYRFILPRTQLKVAGGRITNLRDMQSWIFYAGCTSIMSGNYLTTAGRSVAEDRQMLADLGLEAV
jgi:biotin synthase